MENVEKVEPEKSIDDMVKEDPRYRPLTPKHYQNKIHAKSQFKHYESDLNKWKKENKEARKINGQIYKEIMTAKLKLNQ